MALAGYQLADVPPPPLLPELWFLLCQLEHLADRFSGRVLDAASAPAAFVRVRPDGQKFSKDEDAADDAATGTPGVGAGAAAGRA